MRNGRGIALAGIAALAVAAAYAVVAGFPTDWWAAREAGRYWQVDTSPLEAHRRGEFDAWLAAEPDRAREFADFEAFIAREGFADLLPAWTLLRANASNNVRCPVEPFILPPRRLWRNVVPTLRLVRDEVVPAIGAVQVASAYRDPVANDCSKGAHGSRHLSFHALDLVPVRQPPAPDHFARLCAAWRQAGGSSRWGLGAYFDPEKPDQNRVGRFHVDGTGWRTWGFSYTRASSRCVTL